MPGPFVGGTYNLTSVPASVQRTVNMMPVPIEPGNEREGYTFLDVPGLKIFNLLEYTYFTSQPYAYELDEQMTFSVNAASGFFNVVNLISIAEEMAFSVFPQSGFFTDLLVSYSWSEEMKFSVFPVSGALVTPLIAYTVLEEMQFSVIAASGSLPVVLLSYTNWPDEPMQFTVFPISGTLI